MFLVMAATLPLSALLARRLPLRSVAKMALAWVAVFAVGLVIVGQRETLRPLYDGAVRALTGDDPQLGGWRVEGSTLILEPQRTGADFT